MLAGLFRSNQPVVQFATPLVVLALLLSLVSSGAGNETSLMPLAAIADDFIGNSTWSKHVMGLLLVLLIAIQLTALVNRLELMERRNHLIALLFPVWFAGLATGGVYDPALLGMPVVLLALRRAWSINNSGPALSLLFDAGLLIGLAALCYMPYAFIIVVLWSSTSVIRPFAWREYLAPLLAIALIFFLAWAALLVTGAPPWRPLLMVAQPRAQPVEGGGYTRIAFLVLAAMVLLVGLAAFASGYTRSIMRGKNLRSSFLSFTLALGVLSLLLWMINGHIPWVFAAVPLSVISAYAFLAPRKAWLAEIAAVGLFALSCWARWSQ